MIAVTMMWRIAKATRTGRLGFQCLTPRSYFRTPTHPTDDRGGLDPGSVGQSPHAIPCLQHSAAGCRRHRIWCRSPLLWELADDTRSSRIRLGRLRSPFQRSQCVRSSETGVPPMGAASDLARIDRRMGRGRSGPAAVTMCGGFVRTCRLTRCRNRLPARGLALTAGGTDPAHQSRPKAGSDRQARTGSQRPRLEF